ncbi:SsgA family sporulation/cell division regulator [Nonomuraea sp. NPDC051941]|uniref:SsgA family sporulation/cell division regulator n=1 Tax=Nonomuraea sp. NPDC051941 TaxID=3364373 RepID=UPI0037C84D37
MKRATSVTQALTLWPVDQHQVGPGRWHSLPQGQEPVQAVLAFEADDPYAAHLLFPHSHGDAGEMVSWQFARTLLIVGQGTAAGEGNVQVGPHEAAGYLVITLVPEHGIPLKFFAARALVAKFVQATIEAVPIDREHERIDWDRELAALLGHRVKVTFREADGCFGRTRPGTLAADPTDRAMVVITVPSSAGSLASWRISRDELAREVERARRVIRARSRDILLAVPGDAELLLGVGAVQEFLLASFHTALDGAS